jgi:hypothetical protein
MNIKSIIREVLDGQILQEGVSDIAYHFTWGKDALNIIKSDSFILKAVVDTSYEEKLNKKRLFFFSTTRSKSTGYNKGNVKFVLDTRKLKHRYSFNPVEYWGIYSRPKENDIKSDLKKYEQEDRIVTNKPVIENARSYILAVHLELMLSDIPLVKACIENNIPIFVYENRKDFLNQRNPIKKSEIDKKIKLFDKVNFESEEQYDGEDIFNYDLAALISYKDNNNYNVILDYLEENEDWKILLDRSIKNLAVQHNITQITEEYKEIIRLLNKPKYFRTDERNFLMDLLSKDMRKYKATNLKDYINIKFEDEENNF